MQMYFASDIFYFYKDDAHYYFYYVNYKNCVSDFNRNIYIITPWRYFLKCQNMNEHTDTFLGLRIPFQNMLFTEWRLGKLD